MHGHVPLAWPNVRDMRFLACLLLILAVVGCSGGSSSPVRPRGDDGPPIPIDGTYSNLPRHPHVEVVIDSTGAWQARVWNPSVKPGEESPYITCQDTLLALTPIMEFAGRGAADTTAHLLGFWKDTTHPRLPMYGYLEARYHHTFLTKHGENAGPVISGKFILSIGGACQQAEVTRFWLPAGPE